MITKKISIFYRNPLDKYGANVLYCNHNEHKIYFAN